MNFRCWPPFCWRGSHLGTISMDHTVSTFIYLSLRSSCFLQLFSNLSKSGLCQISGALLNLKDDFIISFLCHSIRNWIALLNWVTVLFLFVQIKDAYFSDHKKKVDFFQWNKCNKCIHTPLFIQRIKKRRERTVLKFCKHCGDVVRASAISRAKTSIYIQPPSLLLLYVSSHPDGSTTTQSKSF